MIDIVQLNTGIMDMAFMRTVGVCVHEQVACCHPREVDERRHNGPQNQDGSKDPCYMSATVHGGSILAYRDSGSRDVTRRIEIPLARCAGMW